MYIGAPRIISFPFCTCECDAVTLIKFNYWPGSPVNPNVAFSFEFMDLLEALLLECQVAVQDFTQAWSYLITQKLIKVCIDIAIHIEVAERAELCGYSPT